MNEKHYQLVRQEYESSGEDYTGLFRVILSIAEETSLDDALQCLERCVTEDTLSWLEDNFAGLEKTGDPIDDAYKLFYETFLGVSAPKDGEIAEQTESRLVIRWRNRCRTLEACTQLGLDTREICPKAYRNMVQAFLSRIDPRLRFEPAHDRIRPHAAYCEEVIMLEEQERK